MCYISQGSQRAVLTARLDFVNEIGIFHGPPYSVSKAAASLLVAKFQASYRDQGILFLSLCPGAVDTDANRPDRKSLSYLRTVSTNAVANSTSNSNRREYGPPGEDWRCVPEAWDLYAAPGGLHEVCKAVPGGHRPFLIGSRIWRVVPQLQWYQKVVGACQRVRR